MHCLNQPQTNKICSYNYEFRPSAGGKRPEFTSPLRDQFGAERGDVKFDCEVSAEPRAEIQWFRGSKELVDSSKISIFNKGATQTLLIRNLHMEDQDEYTCRGTNNFGSTSVRAQLKLSGEHNDLGLHDDQKMSAARPRLFVPPRLQLGIEVEKSQSLELSIPYKAFPAVSAQWSKDGEKLASSGRFTTTVDDR